MRKISLLLLSLFIISCETTSIDKKPEIIPEPKKEIIYEPKEEIITTKEEPEIDFKDFVDIELQEIPNGIKHNGHMFYIKLKHI